MHVFGRDRRTMHRRMGIDEHRFTAHAAFARLALERPDLAAPTLDLARRHALFASAHQMPAPGFGSFGAVCFSSNAALVTSKHARKNAWCATSSLADLPSFSAQTFISA